MEVPVLWLRILYLCVLMSVWRSQYCGYESLCINVSMEVPVLWLRVDPEFQWLRQLSVEQPDTLWHSMLKYERDAVAQVEVSHCVRREREREREKRKRTS